ncbi:hypothetical protein [Methylibium petroleiphilum]|uniref:hypothetical protein n=1 Tax=Methylibium petroleiphilum TaxID=105560 RepID=UPI001AC4F481|nr:hypothetical protein [Methylibium petroleiphilum]MBN9203661.1 hypothetical protein [Methylibium petroleiphilum]
MEIQCSLQRLPVRPCLWQRALERWRHVLAGLRRWLGRARQPAAYAPDTRRTAQRRRVVMHLHRTVVVDEIAPPHSPRLPAPAPHPAKESPHEKLPPQQP